VTGGWSPASSLMFDSSGASCWAALTFGSSMGGGGRVGRACGATGGGGDSGAEGGSGGLFRIFCEVMSDTMDVWGEKRAHRRTCTFVD
jgi:hypothetical protein